MYDLETSPPCGPVHYRVANEWLRHDEPIAEWFTPSRPGRDFINPRRGVKVGRWTHRNTEDKVMVSVGIHSVSNVVSVAQSLDRKFLSLVTEWREAIENVSSLTDILSHPAYQNIIEIGKRGEPVVPLILNDLAKNKGYWAVALQAITGENPVDARHIGNPAKVREDWLAWGRRSGYRLDR